MNSLDVLIRRIRTELTPRPEIWSPTQVSGTAAPEAKPMKRAKKRPARNSKTDEGSSG